jgi:general secretion pathway protein K
MHCAINRFSQLSGGSCKGSALLIVLLLLGIISALAAVVARSVSGAAIEMRTAVTASQAEADLRAGIELGVAAILKLGENMRTAEATANLSNRRITVRISNERGRIDLNMADVSVLAALFEKVAPDSDAKSLAASLVEWIGGSASQKLSTPASDDRSFGPSSAIKGLNAPQNAAPRNAPKQVAGARHLLHPMQLASVPGFTKALVKDLLPYITVANASNQIDPFIAPDLVIDALPGASPERADAFRAARDGDTTRDMAILTLGVAKSLITADAALGWRLQITSRPQIGRSHSSEAVIAVLNADTEAYRVLYVLDE